jgi:hypothetical protein
LTLINGLMAGGIFDPPDFGDGCAVNNHGTLTGNWVGAGFKHFL